MTFKYLTKVKGSPYVDQLIQVIDAWKTNPYNAQLIAEKALDYPQYFFSDPEYRYENIEDYLEVPFRTSPDAKYDSVSEDYIVVKDGVINGYFNILWSTREDGCKYTSCIRHWRFGGSDIAFGLAQKEFLDYIYNTFDFAFMSFSAVSDFTKGTVTGRSSFETDENKIIANDSVHRIFEWNEQTTGFAQPGMLLRAVDKYDGVFLPYNGMAYDLNGDICFYHSIAWLCKSGIEKGIDLPKYGQERTPELLQKLNEHGIKGYI